MALSQLDISDLIIFAAQGLGPREIGRHLNRSPGAISQMAKKHRIAWKGSRCGLSMKKQMEKLNA
jgi:hypothetical protein